MSSVQLVHGQTATTPDRSLTGTPTSQQVVLSAAHHTEQNLNDPKQYGVVGTFHPHSKWLLFVW